MADADLLVRGIFPDTPVRLAAAVACPTERNQILGAIITAHAPLHYMVNRQPLGRSAVNAAIAVSLQHNAANAPPCHSSQAAMCLAGFSPCSEPGARLTAKSLRIARQPDLERCAAILALACLWGYASDSSAPRRTVFAPSFASPHREQFPAARAQQGYLLHGHPAPRLLRAGVRAVPLFAQRDRPSFAKADVATLGTGNGNTLDGGRHIPLTINSASGIA